jgi:chromosome segregation ATPase
VHSRGLELQSAAESRNAEVEAQMREAHETIERKDSEMKDLNERLTALQSETESLMHVNEALKQEISAKLVLVDELQEKFASLSSDKEAAAEKLAVHEETIKHLTEAHTRSLELHSAAESKNGDTEVKLHEALETIAQREAEVKDLSKKLDALEIELGYYEEQATEAAANEENHKVKFDEAVHKLKNLEAQLAETQNKVELFHAEKENLISANSSLNEELEVHQSKLNELQLALTAALAEKQGSLEETHSLRKTLDGMIQRKEELESRVIKCSILLFSA